MSLDDILHAAALLPIDPIIVHRVIDGGGEDVKTLLSALALRLNAAARDLEECRADTRVRDVTLENTVHRLESRLRAASLATDRLEISLSECKASSATLAAERDDARSALATATETAAKADLECAAAKRLAESTEQSRREALELLDRQRTSLHQLEEENDALATRVKDEEKRSSQLQASIHQLSLDLGDRKLRESELLRRVEALNLSNERLAAEIVAKSDELSALRREKATSISDLHQTLTAAQAESSSAVDKLRVLTSRAAELESDLESALARDRDATIRLTTQEAAFRREIDTSKRLNTAWERANDELARRIHELEKERAELRAEVDTATSESQAFNKTRDDEIANLHAQIDRNEVEMSKLHSELAAANDLIGGALTTTVPTHDFAPVESRESTPQPQRRTIPLLLSPTAAIASRMQKSGRSFTEVYQEYIKLQDELREERSEKHRLDACLKQILAEIQERAPLLESQRQEYERMCDELTEMSVKLASALSSRDEMAEALDRGTAVCERAETESTMLREENTSLTAQIRRLLLDSYERDAADRLQKGLPPPVVPMEAQSPNLDPLSPENDVVKQHLTVFASITELHDQNLKLLRVIRELKMAMEIQEQKRTETLAQEEVEAVNQAREIIEGLQDQLRRTSARADSFMRERDMLRSMLEQSRLMGPGRHDRTTPEPTAAIDSAGLLSELQANFDAYRKEIGVDLRTLREQFDTSLAENSQLKIHVARMETQVKYHEERYELLKSNITLHVAEANELRRQNAALQAACNKQETYSSQLARDLVEEREHAEKFKSDVVIVRAELEALKTTENRYTLEIDSLRKERANLNTILHDLQSNQDVLLRAEAGSKRKAENRITQLESELLSRKQRVGTLEEQIREFTLRKDLDAKEQQSRNDKLQEEIKGLRESQAVLKTTLEHRGERCRELDSQLSAATKTIDAMKSSLTVSGQTDQSASLDKLQAQLDELGRQVLEKDENITQFQAIAQAAEDSLADLQTTCDSYKESVDARERERESMLDSIRADRDDLKARLDSIDEELSARDRAHADSVREWVAKCAELESRTKRLQESEAAIKEAAAGLRKDVHFHISQTRQAQDRYNVELIAHANDVKILSESKETLRHLESRLSKYQSECDRAKAALTACEKSRDSQKEVFSRTMEDLETRYREMQQLNSKLHEDYEQMKKTTERLSDATTEVTQDVPVEAQNTVENLRDVVGLLRNENERLALQRDLAQQEASRLEQELQAAQRSLDQTRASLAGERHRLEETINTQEKHEELLAKINELNILRESNSTLRTDNRHSQRRVEDLQQKVARMFAEINPLRSSISEAEAKLDVFAEEKVHLMEDRDRWRERATRILSTHQRIDPVEHEQLAKEHEALKLAVDGSKAELEKAKASINALEDAKANAEAKMEKLTEAGRSWRDKAREAQQQLLQLQEERSAGQETDRAAQEEARRAADEKYAAVLLEKEQADKRIMDAKEKYDKVRQMAKDYRDRVKELEAQVVKFSSENEQLREASTQLQSLKLELEERTAAIESLESKLTATKDDDEADLNSHQKRRREEPDADMVAEAVVHEADFMAQDIQEDVQPPQKRVKQASSLQEDGELEPVQPEPIIEAEIAPDEPEAAELPLPRVDEEAAPKEDDTLQPSDLDDVDDMLAAPVVPAEAVEEELTEAEEPKEEPVSKIPRETIVQRMKALHARGGGPTNAMTRDHPARPLQPKGSGVTAFKSQLALIQSADNKPDGGPTGLMRGRGRPLRGGRGGVSNRGQ